MFFRGLIAIFLFFAVFNAFGIESCKLGQPESFNQLPSVKEENCFFSDQTLFVHGIIDIKTLTAVKELNVKRIILNSPGGSTSVAIQLAKEIREKNIETEILADGYCHSSCTLVFQAGVERIASKSSQFLYHCAGVGRFMTAIFQQTCGADLTKYSDKCKKDLDDSVQSTVLGTKDYFKEYNKYDGHGIYEALLATPDRKDWFEEGEFCKKRMYLTAEQTMPLNAVQKLSD